MADRIEWPFETVRYVGALDVSPDRHLAGRCEASPTRSADKEERSAPVATAFRDHRFHAIAERWINAVVGKGLPLDEQRRLAQLRQVRNSNERPFRVRPHIDQKRSCVPLEAGPCFVHRHVGDVDRVVRTLNHVSLSTPENDVASDTVALDGIVTTSNS